MTGIFLGATTPSKVFVGDTQVSKVFVGDTKVRPTGGGGWQPGVNTIAYYPLTQNANDNRGNYDMIAGSLVTFDSNGALFPQSGYYRDIYIKEDTLQFNSSNTYTVSYWQNTLGKPSGSDNRGLDIKFNNARIFTMCENNGEYKVAMEGINLNATCYFNSWHNCVFIINNGVAKWYFDGVLIGTNSSFPTGGTTNWIGWGNEQNLGANRRLYGYVKDIIMESVEWSAQDISNYYNQTKGNYGIS